MKQKCVYILLFALLVLHVFMLPMFCNCQPFSAYTPNTTDFPHKGCPHLGGGGLATMRTKVDSGEGA